MSYFLSLLFLLPAFLDFYLPGSVIFEWNLLRKTFLLFLLQSIRRLVLHHPPFRRRTERPYREFLHAAIAFCNRFVIDRCYLSASDDECDVLYIPWWLSILIVRPAGDRVFGAYGENCLTYFWLPLFRVPALYR